MYTYLLYTSTCEIPVEPFLKPKINGALFWVEPNHPPVLVSSIGMHYATVI